MRILVTGNLGYIGPVLGKSLKNYFNDCYLIGLDTGLFLPCFSSYERTGDTFYDKQIFKDVRDITISDLKNVDVIVNLAAVSNDPIGKDFESATEDINFKATINLAKLASQSSVSKFIFASSCSVYGKAGDKPKTESDLKDPLTAYAKSKIGVEEFFKENKIDNLNIVCLRFPTACGISDRLRLDLVLNDFVTSAFHYKKISILSNGSPWRPLIDVKDMSKAVIWAIKYKTNQTKSPLSINVGANEWNYQVKDIATKVKKILPDTVIEINKNAAQDLRSYRVDFTLYKELAKEFYPTNKIENTIEELIRHVKDINVPDNGFRGTHYIRLNHVKNLVSKGLINKNLRWI